MDDVEYVDVGNEFGDYQTGIVPKWRDPKNFQWKCDLVKKALSACGRKKFADRKEFSFFRKLDKACVPMVLNPNNIFAREWVDSCINWAAKKNKGRYIAIKLPALISLLKNEAKFNDFSEKWKEKHHAEKRGKIRVDISDDNIEIVEEDL